MAEPIKNDPELPHGQSANADGTDVRTWGTANPDDLGPNAPWYGKLSSQVLKLLSQILTVGGILGLLSVLVTCAVLYGAYIGFGRLWDMGDRFVESQIETNKSVVKNAADQTTILATMNKDATTSRENMGRVAKDLKDAVVNTSKLIEASADNDKTRLELITRMTTILERQSKLPAYYDPTAPAYGPASAPASAPPAPASKSP